MAVIVHCASCGAALPSGGGQCPECLLLLGLRDGQPGENGSADLPSHSALRSFGDYELIEEIARGGMGVVFKARQVSLNRIVAVKMILAGHFAGPASVRRFRTEAEATAKLRHPNIVAIHEVAEHDGQLFFSMDYIEGQNLVAVVREKSMAVRRAAALLRTVAEAIHYAHGQGLVHRDLKPSNILLDADGQPHVTDFGLAKQMFATDVRRFTAPGSEATVTKGESEKAGEVGSASKSPSLPPAYLSSTENQSLLTAELTLTGQVLGSPNYISPEQATGKRGTTGPASDVYALGAVLCHLLTGRAPFVGETLTDILDQVLHKEPASPRLLNPAVPRDLETICLKCLEKDPARRYATAQELAEELGRFLRDEPIRACPASQWEKAWRWCRRKPLVAGLAAGVLLLLLAVAVGSPLAAYHIQRQRERADAEAAHARASEQQAQANLAQAETNLWASYLAQAQARRWSRRPGQRFESLDALKKAAAIRPSIELRNEAVACLALRDLRVTKEWDVEPREGSNVGPNFSYEQVDQTGERLVWVGTNGIVRVQRIADGHELLALPGFPRSNVLPSFDPTGRLLLVGSIFFDGEKPNKTKTHFKVFDLANGHAICSNTVPRAYIWFISPDSRMLVVLHLPSSGTNFVGIYDLGRGEQLERIDVHGTPWSASLHPYKDILAIGFLDGQIEIWDWRKKERRHTLKCPAAVNSMDWHPSSELLVAGCQDFRTYLIDPERERIVTVASDHGSVVPGVRFNHAGDLLASWAWDGTIRLWNPNTGQPVLRTEGGAPMSGFSFDDRWIGCVTGNSRCGLMEVSPAREFRQWQFRAEDKSGSDYVEWSPDGRWLLAANYYGKVHLWDAASGKEVAALPCETPAARFHPTRESLLVSTVNGLKLWPMTLHTEGSDTRLVLGPPEDLLPDVGADFATFDPSGQTLVLNGDGQTYKKHKETFIRFFDLLTRREVRRLSMDPEAYGFTLSRDCRWCAGWAYFSRDLVRVWDVASGQVVRDLMVSYAEGTAFSPDGHILLSQEGQECVAWETGKWRRLYSFPHSSGPQDNLAATFASDGRLAAVRHHVNAALLFDPLTGRELATLEPPEAQMILGLAFSPDGTRLAAATSGKFIQIWDLRALREQLAAIKLDWELPPYPPAPSKTATGSIQVTLLEGTNSLPVQPSSKK